MPSLAALARRLRVFPIRDLNPTRITPYVTLLLIAANVLVYFAWQPHTTVEADAEFLYQRAAVACEITTGHPVTFDEVQTDTCAPRGTQPAGEVAFPSKSLPLSVLVSMFLHGGIAHLLGNMWFLWLFGNNVEEAFGHIRYLLAYLVAGVVATLGFVYLNPASTTPLIGASGAIAGVLGAYAVLFPARLVLSFAFFTLVPVPAIIFLGLWFVGQFAVADGGVAWEAHVAGFVLGVFATLLFRSQLLDRVRRVQRGYYR
jgi:membrane associated rhomboid family serine protease